MAEIDFEDFDAGYSLGNSAGVPRRYDRLIHLAGAATSVALLVGAVWWGYQLAVRDVTGVPVMRALDGPMRIAPADPGGDVAMNQGLSVNAVAAAGTAAPLPDQLFLAPSAQALAEEDAAGLALPTVSAAPQADASALLELTEEPASFAASDISVAAEIPVTDQDAVAAALAEALGQPQNVAAPETLLTTEATTEVTSDAPLTRSLRPMPRPTTGAADAEVTLASATPAPDDALTGTAPELDAASIATGTRLVQLGAFDDADAARADWTRIAGRFPELMTGKSLVVQPAQSGGRTFYRLRAMGFEDEAEARHFCTALLAENATCIPVTQR